MLLYELARFKQSLAFPDKPRTPAFLFVPTRPSFLQTKGPLQVKGRGLLCPSVLRGRVFPQRRGDLIARTADRGSWTSSGSRLSLPEPQALGAVPAPISKPFLRL